MCSVLKFLSDEEGAITLEFVLIVPYFVLTLVFFADIATVYLTHSQMYDLARDAARRMSTGELKDADQVVAYAEQRLTMGQRLYTVFTDFGPNGNMQVLVEIPVSEAAIFGYFMAPLIGENLFALATVSAEPGV